jgi:hypothetical protein
MATASRSLATALWRARFAIGLLPLSYTTVRDTTDSQCANAHKSLPKSRRMSGRRAHLREAGYNSRRSPLDPHKAAREPSAARQMLKSLHTALSRCRRKSAMGQAALEI